MSKKLTCFFLTLILFTFQFVFTLTLVAEAPTQNYSEKICLTLSGLVISNVKVEVSCDLKRSSASEDIWMVSITFNYQIWKPDSFSGLWNPRIIVHFGTDIPKNSHYCFPEFIGPPLPWIKDEDWGKSYPGIKGSRIITGYITGKPPLVPGKSVYIPLYFGLDPSYYSDTKTLQKLEDGEIKLYQVQQVEIRNRLSIRPTFLDFGKVFGDEVLMMPIVLSEENLGAMTWAISSNVSWISVVPNTGNITIGRIAIEVKANSSGLSRGHLFGEILVRSNRGIVSIPVYLFVAVANFDGPESAIRVINFGTSDSHRVSTTISNLLGYGVQLNMGADFQITAGISLPSYLSVDYAFTKDPSSLNEYVARISIITTGTEGGRAWMRLNGGIQGSVTTKEASFGFNFRFNHIDLYNSLTNTDEGWEIDFNRLAKFKVPLNGKIVTSCSTGLIPIYSLDIGMGVLSFSVSFEFSIEVSSYSRGNVTVSGALINSTTVPIYIGEGSVTL